MGEITSVTRRKPSCVFVLERKDRIEVIHLSFLKVGRCPRMM
jgi:hypothetical protein